MSRPADPRPRHQHISLCVALTIDDVDFDIEPSSSSSSASSSRLKSLLSYASSLNDAADGDDADARAREGQRVLRFYFQPDRKRALLAKLAMTTMLSRITSLPPSSLRLCRSSYGKPFIAAPHDAALAVAFNVSHHGDYVALSVEADIPQDSINNDDENAMMNTASSPSISTAVRHSSLPLVGIDVTTWSLHASCKTASEFFDVMRSSFTDAEWLIILDADAHSRDDTVHTQSSSSSSSSSSAVSSSTSACPSCSLIRFAWLWSLKESLIKAIGMGLSFALQHIEFSFVHADRRSVFDPVRVSFLGAPTWTKDVDASSSSSSSTSVPRPNELADVDDLSTDVDWSFDSTMLNDGQHIVTRCRGWRRVKYQQDEASSTIIDDKATSEIVSSSLSSSSLRTTDLTSRVADTHPSRLDQLGSIISYTRLSPSSSSSLPIESDRLQVRRLRLSQIEPINASHVNK